MSSLDKELRQDFFLITSPQAREAQFIPCRPWPIRVVAHLGRRAPHSPGPEEGSPQLQPIEVQKEISWIQMNNSQTGIAEGTFVTFISLKI
jgi:hypothetical protein